MLYVLCMLCTLQFSGLIHFCSRSLLVWLSILCVLMAKANTLELEYPYVVLSQATYVIIALSSLGVKGLGTWQVRNTNTHMHPCIQYLYLVYMYIMRSYHCHH